MDAPTDKVPYPRPLIMRILVRKFVYRHHPKAWAGLAFAASTWLLILGVILCAVGYWWGAVLIAVAALESWVAIRLTQSVQN